MAIAVTIRAGTKTDVPGMLALVKELATYERAPQEVTNTIEMMEQDGFGNQPVFFSRIAESNGEMVGIAIFYIAYSTWKGKCVYLEDIIVTEKLRGSGIGKLLFNEVGKFAKEQEAQQLRWHVLEWNEPAIAFYKKYNTSFDTEWTTCKLMKEQIETLF